MPAPLALRVSGPSAAASRLVRFGAALLLAALSACNEKDATKSSGPPAGPAAPAAPTQAAPLPAAVKRAPRIAAILSKLSAPRPEDHGLPITVRLDAADRTIPIVPRSAPQRYPTPGSPAPNGGIWRSVTPTPVVQTGKSASFYQDGTQRSLDGDNGIMIEHGSDGSTTYSGNGTTIKLFDPNNPEGIFYTKIGPDNSIDVHMKDGTTEHVSPDGSNDYTDWGNGKRSVWGPDGQETIIDLNSGEQKTIDHKTGDTVEIPPLIQTPAGDKPAHGTGEPHYLTRDGTSITTQAAGEFVLATGTDGRRIQARQEPWGASPETSRSVSAITALAFLVGGSTVEVRLDGTVLIDGAPAPDGEVVQGDLPEGGVVGLWRSNGQLRNVVVVWSDLSVVRVMRAWSYLSFATSWKTMDPAQRGILGSNDGDPSNDLTDRDGKLQSSDPDGIKAFVDSWRVTDAESLFTYGPGQSTATFTLENFPQDLPSAKLAVAPEDLAGIPPGPFRDMLAYDLALTGDKRFVESYREFQGQVAALLSRAADRKIASASGQPAGSGATLALTQDDIKGARRVPADEPLKILETIASEGQTYRIRYEKARSHRIVSYTPGPKPSAYVAGQPGFAFFTKDGRIVGMPFPAGSETDRSIDLEASEYVFKVVGPGIVDLIVD